MSYTVNFTDISTPGPSGPITAWAWDFGDGGTSTSENPSHAYAAAGTYNVTLTVTGTSPDGTDLIMLPVTVVAAGAISAKYSFSASGRTVTFTDQSTPGPSGPITAWAWNFGDSNTSTSQNPVHTFAADGTYNVQLQVTGTGGDGTSTVTHNITVAATGGTTFETITNYPRPSFTPIRTVHFHDEATLRAAIVNMQDGDLIQITPGTGHLFIQHDGGISSSTAGGGQAMKVANKKWTNGVVIDLGTYSCVQNPALESSDYTEIKVLNPSMKDGYSAFFIQSLTNVTIYGGSLTGDGAGILAYGDLTNFKWFDYYVHDVAGGGLNCLPVSPSSNGYKNVFFRGEVTKAGRYPLFDPHADKGTGIHGNIFENSGSSTGNVDGCTSFIYAHELGLQPGESSYGKVWPEGSIGAGGPSIGNSTSGAKTLNNLTFAWKVVNGYMHPGNNGGTLNPGSTGIQKDGTVGANFWGSTPINAHILWAEADNTTGTNFHCQPGNWHTGTITVDHGRSHNVCTYSYGCPAPNDVAYPTGFGIHYNDCTIV